MSERALCSRRATTTSDSRAMREQQGQKFRQPRGTRKLASSARPFPSSAHGPGTFTTASALVGNLLSI